MNTVFRALVCATAILAASGAAADPQVIGDQNDAVQIKAPGKYQVAPAEFDEYAYAYALDNGSKIKFTQRVARYFAQLDHDSRVELLPLAPGVFMTASGARVQFSDEGDTVTIRNYERLAVGQNLPANTIVMAQR